MKQAEQSRCLVIFIHSFHLPWFLRNYFKTQSTYNGMENRIRNWFLIWINNFLTQRFQFSLLSNASSSAREMRCSNSNRISIATRLGRFASRRPNVIPDDIHGLSSKLLFGLLSTIWIGLFASSASRPLASVRNSGSLLLFFLPWFSLCFFAFDSKSISG